MEQIDWIRLQKALAIEAETGFQDIQGNQYRFSEFLCLSFGQTPPIKTSYERSRWQQMANRFARYQQSTLSQRQVLVAEARSLIFQVKQALETPPAPPEPKQPRTIPINTVNASSKIYLTLDRPLKEIPDIGTLKSQNLQRLNLFTVRDLLFYYPRDYIDYARQVNIAQLVAGETVTILGKVKRCNCFNSPKNKQLTIFEIILGDRTGQIKLNRFFAGARFSHRGWQEKYKHQFPVGSIVAASGLVKQSKYALTLENPELEVLDSTSTKIESMKIGRILPIYPLTEGVPADLVRKSVITVISASEQIIDPLPVSLQNQYGLIKLPEAIAQIHFPADGDRLTHARRRLVFDEFFYLQLGFLQRRQQQKKTQTTGSFIPRGELLEKFNGIIPFTLTNAQKRVIGEILQDLEKSTPMNRLVQGDVGSGKTIVGVYAILAAIQSGYQAALMAPTEVLAEQHYRKLIPWFNLLNLPAELLTGSTKVAKRRQIHSQLSTGELPLLVGTHALIQDAVNFHRLGLAVIDEQHRFGVEQRARLLAKGQSPHVLSMTATPIPRTLALTLHGDLDVSQIDELPPGRQEITTTILTSRERPQVYELIRREIAQGRQVYIIFPLVEESEKLDLKAAVDEHERLAQVVFKEFEVGLLHGRMKTIEKEEALSNFRDNQTQIIVSTTVIEVGVDVPNATVMLIEHAERFGLSQLHQLRGRVGRGQNKSFCFLMTSSKNQEARQRLKVLEESQDGFFIAEMDLRLRGPGEVLGRKQSGLPDFALASLVEDREVLNLAREAAEKMIFADPELKEFPNVARELERRYQKMIGADILN